jgi:hypothetical protein
MGQRARRLAFGHKENWRAVEFWLEESFPPGPDLPGKIDNDEMG